MSKAYLEPQEIIKLEQAAEYLRDKLLIRLLFHLGCRVSEALGITVKDLDFKNKTVTIQHLKTRINLACPDCGARLGKIHKFCPVAGIRSNRLFQRLKNTTAIGSCRLIKRPWLCLKNTCARVERLPGRISSIYLVLTGIEPGK